MADIFFFTDTDLLESQTTNANSFGPYNSNDGSLSNSEFRITSRFTVKNIRPAKAYAITEGRVIIQPVIGKEGTTVNLILEPSKLTNSIFPVKFFIYRGLKLSSFISNNKIAPDGTSEFVDQINTEFREWKEMHPDSLLEKPPLGRIAYDKKDDDENILLDTIFNQPYGDFGLAYATPGMHLGDFDNTGKIGIEIVLRDFHFKTTLGTARLEDNIISVFPPQSSDIPGNENIAKMGEREQILDFIDPAVFYSYLYRTGVAYKESNQPENIFLTDNKIPSDVYNKLLKFFMSKNTVYIDIRNENGYSLNYYKDNKNEDDPENTGHLKINNTEVNYYAAYWPVYTVNIEDKGSEILNFQFNFRKKYNPKPLLYIENGDTRKSIQLGNFPGGRDRFLYERQEIPQPPDLDDWWSDKFTVYTPNFPDLPGFTSPAWLIKLILVRPVLPELVPLPPTAIPRTNYLDNIFGPIHEEPPYISVDQTNFISLGKKFLNAMNELGFSGMVEVFFGRYSDAEVIYIAEIIDGFDANSNIINNLKNINNQVIISSPEKPLVVFNRTLEKYEIVNKKSIIDIEPPKYTITDTGNMDKENKFLMFLLTDGEFTSARTAANALDPSLHDVYFSFDNYSQGTDSRGHGYGNYRVRISGLDNLGNYLNISAHAGELFAYTENKYLVATSDAAENSEVEETCTDPNAYFDVDRLIEFIKRVEESYPDENLLRILTRIRVEYYGWGSQGDGFFGKVINVAAFLLSIPCWDRYFIKQTPERVNNDPLISEYTSFDAESVVSILFDQYLSSIEDSIDLILRNYSIRRLYKSNLDKDAYMHLTAHGDENYRRENPGPYIYDPNGLKFDFGHAIYGMEVLIDNISISNFYGEGWNIKASIILAGYLADIGIAIGEYYYTFAKEEIPAGLKSKIYYPIIEGQPTIEDMDRFYEISAPNEDILGDVEAFGWFRAYKSMVAINPNVKFSEVLHYYYKYNFEESYTNRWKLFCETDLQYSDRPTRGIYNRFITPSNGAYIWDPDITDINTQLDNFCEFWYNKCASGFKTMIGGLSKQNTLYSQLFLQQIRNNDQYKNFRNLIRDRFLNEVKNHLNSEQGWNL